MPDAGPASTRAVVEHYIRGLHWVLQYYYRGVASWDWFYPYHYAPMAQDMRRLDNIQGAGNDGANASCRDQQPMQQAVQHPASSSSKQPVVACLTVQSASTLREHRCGSFWVRQLPGALSGWLSGWQPRLHPSACCRILAQLRCWKALWHASAWGISPALAQG